MYPAGLSGNAENCVATIKKLNAEIAQQTTRIKQLRQQCVEQKKLLLGYMNELKVDELGGIRKSTLEPKPKITAEARRASAVEYLERQGIDNPEQFYALLKQTQSKEYIMGSHSYARGPNAPRVVYEDWVYIESLD